MVSIFFEILSLSRGRGSDLAKSSELIVNRFPTLVFYFVSMDT